MNTKEMQEEIIRLKKEKNICILVHAYQSHDIFEVADFIGDSFGLSQKAAKTNADTVLMCGVRFMADTVKILSPEKKVLLSNADAGCPMAEQITPAEVIQLRKQYPDHAVVCYINTTTALKAVCDVCVTSSSAPKIIRTMQADKILFIPDCNLGSYIAKLIPEKTFQFVNGGCPSHLKITTGDIDKARLKWPGAKVLIHPECQAKVTAMADFVGSTTEIMSFAEKSQDTDFIIGTENSIVQHLQMNCPSKRFHAASKDCICQNMKLTTLGDVYACVNGTGGDEIIIPEPERLAAKRCIDEMLRLG